MCGYLSCPKSEGSGGPLILYLNTVLPLFVLAVTTTLIIVMTITLKCLQETNTGCSPCLLLLPFQTATRRLLVIASTGAHLSPNLTSPPN